MGGSQISATALCGAQTKEIVTLKPGETIRGLEG